MVLSPLPPSGLLHIHRSRTLWRISGTRHLHPTYTGSYRIASGEQGTPPTTLPRLCFIVTSDPAPPGTAGPHLLAASPTAAEDHYPILTDDRSNDRRQHRAAGAQCEGETRIGTYLKHLELLAAGAQCEGETDLLET